MRQFFVPHRTKRTHRSRDHSLSEPVESVVGQESPLDHKVSRTKSTKNRRKKTVIFNHGYFLITEHFFYGFFDISFYRSYYYETRTVYYRLLEVCITSDVQGLSVCVGFSAKYTVPFFHFVSTGKSFRRVPSLYSDWFFNSKDWNGIIIRFSMSSVSNQGPLSNLSENEMV